MTQQGTTQQEFGHGAVGSLTGTIPTLDTDGVPIHLVTAEPALRAIADAAAGRSARPLGVVSVNLDHLHHFGRHAPHAVPLRVNDPSSRVEWLSLIDGSPIARFARRATGREYPKLSGSDLIGSVLDRAAAEALSVGILGGTGELTPTLRARFGERWPGIRFAGHWCPTREELAAPARAAALAADIRATGVDLLLVCLGKPRQETWIEQHGPLTGAGALLAFGAVVDFLAGRVTRAPGWVSRAGLEWAWRLALEPRRLARRYLIQGPPAYWALRRSGTTPRAAMQRHA
ncbi:WecB/TagA/CpsF family glycosyltransferase [Microbacterium album]|uniref:Glycosyltransferase n=1 Tax=Microbacterium album TaxID=2053191 RepID=A0A917IFU5_9MICO|nr:WecB/TagA/CpsF family glycosyltransferase [Microbacterium album]GGH49089.1 hypothetical protein GCM10010921_27050 [Microbacterium album]